MTNQISHLSSVPASAADIQRPLGWSDRTTSANEAMDGVRVVSLDPNAVAPSRYANRLEFNWESAAFHTLKADILATKGNLSPIKVREAADGSSVRYEIVYGHRRHRACFEHNLKVSAIVGAVSDVDLVLQMNKENSHRHECSPYERGMQFKLIRAEGIFSSNGQLAEAIDLDQSEVARLIRLANLPDQVIKAFKSPADIRVKWEAQLSKALTEDPQGTLMRAAAIIASYRPGNPKQVLATLCNLPGNPPPAALEREIKIPRAGKPWASIFVPPPAKALGIRIEFEQGAIGAIALEAALHALAAQVGTSGTDPMWIASQQSSGSQ